MKSFLRLVLVFTTLLFMPDTISGQAPDLGTTASFAMFTAAGAFSNDGATVVTGDIGTNVGAFTGFPPGVVIGSIHVADMVSAQAALDVASAYSDLATLTCGQVLGTTLGGGQILTPDIYCLGAASVLNGDLVLDGQCDPSAFFIFQIDGALSTSVLSTVTLINGASLCNVYWQVNGAVELGDQSLFQGTIIASGAITLLEASTLLGRGLTTAGAIEMHNNIVSNEMLPTASILVADGPTALCLGDSVTLSGNCGGVWSTGDTSSTITVGTNDTFFVTNTNDCGVSVSNMITVTVGAIPICTITGVFSVCPGLTTELCVAAGYAEYLWSTGAIVNCITVSVSGTYSVTITDIDGCTSSCSQVVTIEDVLAPVITCPIDISIECDEDTQPIVTGTATATDDCDLAPTVIFSDITIDGACAEDYTLIRTWIATDSSGNVATCQQTISISDNTAPIITCPVVISPIVCGTIPSFGFPTAIDACDATVSFTFTTDSIPGTCAQTYILIRTWTASDDCGNTATCSATIAVEDLTAPMITCPVDVFADCVESTDPITTGFATATDICDATPTITYVDDLSVGVCPIILLRTWTATDDCGNFSTCVQTIELSDTTLPVITCAVVISPIECGSIPDFGVTIAVDDCDPTVAVTFITDSIPGLCGQTYTLIRTFTAIDDCGNSATCSSTIEVQDNTAPVIVCPIILVDTIECGLPISFELVTATDACDASPEITFSDVSIAGVCPLEYSIIRTWVATDDCGNSSSCSVTLVIEDTTAPVLTCPVVVSPIECDDIPDFGVATAIDACDGVVDIIFADITIGGVCDEEFSITRTWMATDDCGNSSTCSATILVEDTTPPVITCAAVLSPISCELTPDFGITTAIDACDPTVTLTFITDSIPGSCEQAYSLIRTWTATDDCGNFATCSATIVVEDLTAPVLICPVDVSADCTASTDPDVTGFATATDICDATPTITYADDLSIGVCPIILLRTWTATDDCGNFSSCVQTIELSDTTPPVITCAVVISPIECGSIPDFGVTIAVDDCDPTVAVTFITDSIPGLCGQAYTLIRTFTAVDDCGNIATCSSTIEVQDTTAPVIVCPIILIDTIECGLPITFELVTATDACDVSPEITFSDVSIAGICPLEYSIIRTWIATDDCGNSSSCSVTIVIEDNIAPVITCPVVVSPIECGTILDFGVATAIDGCDGMVDIIFADITIEGGCDQEFSVTRTWIATDDCGNSSTCSATILVEDSVPPVITCPVVVSPIPCGEIPFFGAATAIDACDVLVTIVFTDVTIQGACAEEYNVTRTWIATDDCGNSASCIASIDVGAIGDLIVTCPPAVTVPCASLLPAIDITLIQVTGNCGLVTVTHVGDVITNQTCLNTFTLTRTYQALDVCGNVGVCSQIITVLDTVAPVITFVNPLIEFGDTIVTQCYGQDPEWDIPLFDAGDITAIDSCGGLVTITYSRSLEDAGDCSVDGYINLYRLTWTATDVCGNSSSAFAFLSLVDTIAPLLVGIPADTTINCDDLLPPVPVFATDECLCACVVLFQEFDTTQTQCQDGLVILRTWTATDRCGNMTIDTQRITLIDREGPELFFVLPEMVELTADSVIEYACHEGGIPAYFDTMNTQSIIAVGTCGGSFEVIFTEEIDVQTNCEFFGYLEQRIFQWTATDLCGNTTSRTITIRLIDNEAPVITGVPEMVCVGDAAFENIEVSDDCDNVSLRFWDVTIPNPCGEGTARRRTYEATDDCGNMALDTTIMLPDNQEVPVIFFTNPLLMQVDSGMTMSIDCNTENQRYTNFGVADIRVEGACADGSVMGFSETVLATGDCEVGGFIAVVQLRWTATDVCGNYGERMLQVNIVDESTPVFVNFTPVLFVGCNDSIPEMAADDNCGEVVMSHTDNIIPGTCVYEYRIERMITARDACGNEISRLQIIHVGNNGGPVITGVEEEICDDLTIPVVTAYDECAGQFVEVSMHQDTLDIECRDGLVIQRTWTATDACGNTTVIHQRIILRDQTAPEIVIPTNSVILRFLDNNHLNLVYQSQTFLMQLLNELNDESVSVLDECDQLIIPVLTTDTLHALDCELAGYAWRITYTWTATDICGNTASVSITVDVMDDVAPEFMEMPTDTTIICAPLPPAPDSILMLDSLELVSIDYTETIVSGPGVGQFTVTRTWTATDSCDNVTVYIQVIIWQPESTMECNIILPELVECNSHGVIISGLISGGGGSYNYEWQVVGEKCFIQGGQGTPDLEIYVGWTEVKIILTVTDTFGCVTMCMVFLNCLESDVLPLSSSITNGSSLILPEHTTIRPSTNTEDATNIGIQEFTLWPNPAKETINIGFESSKEGIVEYSLMDYLGKTLSTNRIFAYKGYNIQQVDAAQLSGGSYMIQLRSDTEFYTRGIMIMGNE